MDATERAHNRPRDFYAQYALYSGKQKDHTIKNTVMCDQKRFILFLGKTTMGSMHDYKLFQMEFDPQFDWLKKVEVGVDLGYQGMATHYTTQCLHLPFKKTNTPLTAHQRAANKVMASARVVVEHAISGIKRFACLVNRFRGRKSDYFEHLIIRICAALWNLHLANTA